MPLSPFSILLCLLVFAPVTAQDAKPGSEAAVTGEIIDTIKDFEARKDAKCYATATRMENYIYGTPLSDEARFAKIDLQKAVISHVWTQASKANPKGSEPLSAEEVRPHLEKMVAWDKDDKGFKVFFKSREVAILQKDFDHYSSIAYALRAILAVQQDFLWSGNKPARALGPDAIDLVREGMDILTLAALGLADKDARAKSQTVISAEGFRTAWESLTTAPKPPAVVSHKDGTGPGFDTFQAIIDQKIKSYTQYNAIDEEKMNDMFMANIRRYYARYALPPGGLTLPEHLGKASAGFYNDVMTRAQTLASNRGDALIRAGDLNEALLIVTPHFVDDLEDAVFFPNLPYEKQVHLEAFDMDSYRDFGMHWKTINIIRNSGQTSVTMEPDPFAAELLAEGMAQYAVLVLRMAGELAKDDGDYPFLMGTHILRAADNVKELADLNNRSKGHVKQAAPIHSASKSKKSQDGAFMKDITAETGIDFKHRSSNWLSKFRHDIPVVPPTFSGGGIAAADVNGDGWEDVLMVGGLGNSLYINDGKGHFTDIGEKAGLNFKGPDGLPGEPRQPIIADFDNDGKPDVFISYNHGKHRLARNMGDGTFKEVDAGLGGENLVGGPATVFDFDRDGLLDIYICYFGDYLKDYFENGATTMTEFKGAIPTMDRNNTNALPNRLFRNMGNMRFEDVTEKAGVADYGWAQAVSHTDFDGDGYQDLFVANDFGRNTVYRNKGNGTFEDISEKLGFIKTYHSMNVGYSDLNQDNHPDIYVSNINMMVKDNRYVLPTKDTELKLDARALARAQIVETSMLYVSAAKDGALSHYEVSEAVERSNAVGWAWDADFFDYDNDGDDDLYVLNGANEYYTYYQSRKVGDKDTFDWNMEPNVFYVNDGGVLRNQSDKSGANFSGNSRSAVYLDLEGDGDLDIVINNFHGSATVFRNETSPANWMKVKLEGNAAKGSNPDAIGARIVATCSDGKTIWREVHGGSGYLSMESKTQHFGLGDASSADLNITWPNGQTQRVKGLKANRTWLIREEDSKPRELN